MSSFESIRQKNPPSQSIPHNGIPTTQGVNDNKPSFKETLATKDASSFGNGQQTSSPFQDSRADSHPQDKGKGDIEVIDIELSKTEEKPSIIPSGYPELVMPKKLNKVLLPPKVVEIKEGIFPPSMLEGIVEETRFAKQVSGGVAFQFDLKGDVLGGMQLEIGFTGGKLYASLTSEHPEIRQLLYSQLDVLRKKLTEKGLELAELDIVDPEEKRRKQQQEQHQKDRQQHNEQEASDTHSESSETFVYNPNQLL